ncbi:MAG: hypothetical protein ACRDN9_09425 [Streptosporangiaceae bacterium]
MAPTLFAEWCGQRMGDRAYRPLAEPPGEGDGRAVLEVLLVALAIGAVVLLPSFAWPYTLFQRSR